MSVKLLLLYFIVWPMKSNFMIFLRISAPYSVFISCFDMSFVLSHPDYYCWHLDIPSIDLNTMQIHTIVVCIDLYYYVKTQGIIEGNSVGTIQNIPNYMDYLNITQQVINTRYLCNNNLAFVIKCMVVYVVPKTICFYIISIIHQLGLRGAEVRKNRFNVLYWKILLSSRR